MELSRSFHRHSLECVTTVKKKDGSFVHTETDVSGESAEVQAVANAVWTTEIKAAKKVANEAAEYSIEE